jgi:hypothetical protein
VERQAQIGTYKLRLCNAYAALDPLEMRRLEEPKIVEYPLPYKHCADYVVPLKEGDQLSFRAGDQPVGVFSVRGLPADTRDTLLLIPHRSDSVRTGVAFASHIFKPSATSAEVAIVDVYQGTEHSTLLLEEPAQREEVRLNSVISLRPGEYSFAFGEHTASTASDAARRARVPMHAQENYLVMRVGVGSKAFPEELVVFPQLSGCRSRASASAWLLGALLAVAWQSA